ncbi:V-type immunoglobulin domain-containing suppressor of T-cell activation [Rhea pennata]|uniref:V-type immunoglobulin domain-containing suppressor of T-cell activation n=1 Tax=Rhea pennata TaxID=8795 RepID=UPI002E260EEE
MEVPPRPGRRGGRPAPRLLAALCLLAAHGGAAAFLVTAPYGLCVCPEGQNVTLTCRVSGPLADRHDLLYKTWYFSGDGDQSCSDKRHVRNATDRELRHEPGRRRGPPANGTGAPPHPHPHGVELLLDRHGAFHIVVTNLTPGDSGNYCCYAAEAHREHSKLHTRRVAHGVVELRIRQGRGVPQNCTFHAAAGKDITAAALATGACIVGILCLPLILLLIYKQRQAVSNRRAHELVRMESSAQGIENPVFEAVPGGGGGGGAETWPRAPLAYAPARQASESGRHLLSEPSTPLSPPGPGECFFPTLDPVPDSPNALTA